MTHTERRASPRQAVTQEVMLSSGMHFRLCQLRELSLHGAFVELGWEALTRAAPIDLMLTLPDGPGTTAKVYHVSGEVARLTSSGTAIKFRPLDEVTTRALMSYLRQQVPGVG